MNRLSGVFGDMLGVEAGDTEDDEDGDGRLKEGLVEPDAGGGGEQLLKMRENGPCGWPDGMSTNSLMLRISTACLPTSAVLTMSFTSAFTGRPPSITWNGTEPDGGGGEPEPKIRPAVSAKRNVGL